MSSGDYEQKIIYDLICIRLDEAKYNLEQILKEDYADLTYSLTEELKEQLVLLDNLIKFLKRLNYRENKGVNR